jgi:polynucleotide 5'-kinase involved in rRNA processing
MANVQAVVYDTSGLISQEAGGANLKLAKIDLLQPTILFAIQRHQELKSLLVPLRRSRRVQIVDLPSSPVAQRRDVSMRQSRRAANFARYFAGSRPLKIPWTAFAVLPTPRFSRHCLLALEDADGFSIGLGIVEEIDHQSRELTLYTPVDSLREVVVLRLGNVAVDPETFRDRQLSFR